MTRPRFIPHPYQRDGIIRHIQALPRAGVFAGMGTGKTGSTLQALVELSLVEEVFPALILAPLRVARSTWPDEVAKWDNFRHLRVSAIAGDAKARLAAVNRPADIYTTNYEQIPWLVEHFKEKWPYKTIVADEWTRLKSFRLQQGSKRAAALKKVAHTLSPRFIGLTGTPAANGLKDLWGQLWFIDRGARLGHSFTAFRDRWFQLGFDGYSLEPMAHAHDEIQNLIRDVCLTVEGLPVDEPIATDVYVDLPAKARSLYRDMEREMLMWLDETQEPITAANAAVRTSKLLQIANGAIYTDENGSWEEVHRAKLEALDSIIEEAAGAPVLVAYNFKHDLARLRRAFPQGRVLDADPQTIRDWNAGRIPLLFAHPASAGHGLNLAEGGNILAFFGLNWNLEEHAQIIERIGPMRQKQAGLNRPMFLYKIKARDTFDDVVDERLGGKSNVQDLLLAALRRAKDGGLLAAA